MNDFLYINHANDYAQDVGAEVFHPMVSVVHVDELGEIRHSLNKMGEFGPNPTTRWSDVIKLNRAGNGTD